MNKFVRNNSIIKHGNIMTKCVHNGSLYPVRMFSETLKPDGMHTNI